MVTISDMHEHDERAAVDINDAGSMAALDPNATPIGQGYLRRNGMMVGPFTGNRHERRKAYAHYRKQEGLDRVKAALVQCKSNVAARAEHRAAVRGSRAFDREVDAEWGSAKEAGHAYAMEERRRQEYRAMHPEGSQ